MNVRATNHEFAPLSRGASGPRRRGCGTAASPFDLTRFVKLTLRRDLQPQRAFGLKIGTPARINRAGRHARALVRFVVIHEARDIGRFCRPGSRLSVQN